MMQAKSTALHRAANNGHDEIVRVLLDAGARVNVKSEVNLFCCALIPCRIKVISCSLLQLR